jgi:ribonuclease HI
VGLPFIGDKIMSSIDIYTDGGYKDGIYAWAFVATMTLENMPFDDPIEVYRDSGLCEEQYRLSNNIGAEVCAVHKALRWAWGKHNTVWVYHDYEGIAYWLRPHIDPNTGNRIPIWNANTPIAKFYVGMIAKAKDSGMNLEFTPIPGHSGNKGNEEADRMCGDIITKHLPEAKIVEKQLLLPEIVAGNFMDFLRVHSYQVELLTCNPQVARFSLRENSSRHDGIGFGNIYQTKHGPELRVHEVMEQYRDKVTDMWRMFSK